MVETVKAAVAAVKVLENWGVKDIYGLPGGSINSLMDALLEEKTAYALSKSVMKKLVQWQPACMLNLQDILV